MIITLQNKVPSVAVIDTAPLTLNVIGSGTSNMTLGQLKEVDISLAETGDVLMFNGTSWTAEDLDGGTFN